MIVLVGTVPYETGVYIGQASIKGGLLAVDETGFGIERGTAAMAAACVQVCSFYGMPMPLCIFGGDISEGKGTDLMFQEVNSGMEKYDPDVVTLHYMFPKIAYGEPFIRKIKSLQKRPLLIADAGGMYLMKTIGYSSLFDVFTPDAGELLFLADELAAHPLYVRTDMLKQPWDMDELAESAYQHKNSAATLVVKGSIDRVYRNGRLARECREPNIPAMEAIGGTGDTITGMLSGLLYRQEDDAEYKALALNRIIGKRLNCNAATQISEFIKAIPTGLEAYEKGIF
jgi:NAD(P)H-hydrate repair Nnr-like enzyme with NAD(P)H-hydrate dehydratase domain